MPTLDDLYTPSQKQTSLSLDSLYTNPAKEGVNDAPRSPGAQFMMESVLPMAGTVAGGAGGVALKTALGIKRMVGPLMAATEGLGSFGGEVANQQLGITPPSDIALGTAAIAPGVGRMIPGVVQNLPQYLPGSAASIRAGIADTARQDITGLIKAPDSKALYDSIPKNQPHKFESFPQTSAAVSELRANIDQQPFEALSKASKESGLDTLLGQIESKLKGKPAVYDAHHFQLSPAQPPQLSLEEVRKTTEALGGMIASAPDGNIRGAYRKLYRSILSDVEKAPIPAGTDAAAWKQARESYKKEIAKTDLSGAIERSITTVEGVDQFHADRVVNWLRKNPEFKARISPQEYAEIESTLRNLGSFTGKRSNKLLAMIIGTVAAGPAGTAAGYIAADKIAEALLKPTVRRAMARWATAGEGKVAQDMAAVITAGVAGGLD